MSDFCNYGYSPRRYVGGRLFADPHTYQCRPSARAIRLKMRYKEVATIFRVRLISIFMSPSFFSLFQILGIIMCVGVSTVSHIIIFHTLGQLHSRVQNYGSEEEASQNAFNINRYKKFVSTAL